MKSRTTLFAAAIFLTIVVCGSVYAGVPQYADTPGDDANAYVSDHATFNIWAKWNIDGANLSAWVVSHNGTGTWDNKTWSFTFASGNWTNTSITTNATWSNTDVVFWRIFVNDSTPAENVTALVATSKMTIDTAEPTYVILGDNVTTIAAGSIVGAYANWSDSAAGLGQYKISYNNSAGTWANSSSWTEFSEWTNTTVDTASYTAGVYGWKLYARDNSTGANENVTAIVTYTVEGNKPTWSKQGQSSDKPIVGHNVDVYAQWNDDYEVYQYIFSNNLSGSWGNSSWTSFAAGNWTNKTLYPSSEGTYGWKVFAKDYSTNINVTDTSTFYAYYSGIVDGITGGGGGGSSRDEPTPTLQEEPVIAPADTVISVETVSKDKIGPFDKKLVYVVLGGAVVYYLFFAGGLEQLGVDGLFQSSPKPKRRRRRR